MTKIEIPEIGFEKEIPSSFDEMSGADYIRFINLWLRLQSKMMDLTRLKTELVYHFLNIRHNATRWQYYTPDDKQLIAVNVHAIAEHLNFLYTEKVIDGQTHLGVNLSWSKNHIPEYKGLIGPADALSDITWIEYKDAMIAATSYIESEDIDDLKRLAAIFYRKKSFWTKKRLPYDPDEVQSNMVNVRNFPFPVLYGIFLFFLSCEKYIREGTFTIDREDITFSLLFTKTEDNKSSGTWMTELLYNLAETGVFGTAKETARQNLFDVLFRLWQVHNDYLKRKQKRLRE